MNGPTADELREHLAYEVHLLVWSAVRFRQAQGKDKMVFQDSALLHARNLLEFTQPTRPRRGWWIADLVAEEPTEPSEYRAWADFINAAVTHMGDTRLNRLPWPVAKDDDRLVELGQFVVRRIQSLLPEPSKDEHVAVMREIARLGLLYLCRPADQVIAEIARLVDEPLNHGH